ncbi:MAG: EthD family reductase [Gemmatimonadota bacterium]|nr:EthD family reductase [Gemmatimonadota bacterium]
MPTAKLVVLYPNPKDPAAFESAYKNEHLPMVNNKTMPGLRKFIETKIVGMTDGSKPPYAKIAELHFDSIEALMAFAGTEGAKKGMEHAISISSGGTPVLMVAQEEAMTF